MSDKIDPELGQRLRQIDTAHQARQIPVIVTLTEGADTTELERRGLKIQHRYQSIPAVSGTLTAAGVSQLAALDSVARIELDGTAWALEEDRP